MCDEHLILASGVWGRGVTPLRKIYSRLYSANSCLAVWQTNSSIVHGQRKYPCKSLSLFILLLFKLTILYIILYNKYNSVYYTFRDTAKRTGGVLFLLTVRNNRFIKIMKETLHTFFSFLAFFFLFLWRLIIGYIPSDRESPTPCEK